jgi:hypothetical protein
MDEQQTVNPIPNQPAEDTSSTAMPVDEASVSEAAPPDMAHEEPDAEAGEQIADGPFAEDDAAEDTSGGLADMHDAAEFLASEADDGQDGVFLSRNKVKVLVAALRACEQNVSGVIAGAIRLLEKDEDGRGDEIAADLRGQRAMELAGVRRNDGRVVEGVFDGQNMVGSDGKIYSVPPNYASKSKLVEGDLLKLTITGSGSFIYKQIGPIERVRIVAELGFDPTVGEYYATHDNRRWNVLKASVTYFKGDPSDEAVVLVPKNGPSKWAAVENVIKKASQFQQ